MPVCREISICDMPRSRRHLIRSVVSLMHPVYAMSNSLSMPHRIIRRCIVTPVKPYQLIAQLVVDSKLGGRPGLGSLPLAKKIGRPERQSQIYKFLNGAVDEPARSTVEPVADFFGIPVDAFYNESVAINVARARGMFGLSVMESSDAEKLAHSMSQSSATVAPQDDSLRIKWGSMNYEALPDIFRVQVPDNAMADDIKKGYLAKFDKQLKPRADDFVLLSDSSGEWWFRAYKPGAAGSFSAVALASGFPPMHSDEHGLKVLAVYIGHSSEGRRG